MSSQFDDRSDGATRHTPDTSHDPIARNIRRAFDAVANEPLPDDLKQLLERLKQQGTS